MVGRKASVPPAEVINAILSFKDEVIINDEDVLKVAVATNKVWSEISKTLNYRMSSNALHTFVQLGRHGVLDKIGLPKKETVNTSPKQLFVDKYDNSSNENSDWSSDTDMPTKKFVFTFSAEEWKTIQPEEIVYQLNDNNRPIQKSRSYFILPKGTWTPLLAEHFWLHTELPCCLSFKRAKVYPNGQVYIKIIGRCSICESHFEGTVAQKPPGNARVIMLCIYQGFFDEKHKVKKRRLIGPAKQNALISLVENNKSSETYRETEAKRILKIGAQEPAILPSGNALRILKHRNTESKKRHTDVLTALSLMREEDDFKNVLHNMGIHPFFLHYCCSEQIHIYRNYCRNVKYPRLIIDATGSIVKNFKKFGINKTRNIFLYEALAYDTIHTHGFTVSNMLSERHNNTTIYNWLSEWMNFNVPPPKETVCDMSLALLSAITQCFTQYSSLRDYIAVCADLTIRELPIRESHWLPRCFIRVDVAHFIKLAAKWMPLKTVSRRAREVILRTVGQIIKCQNLTDVKHILFSLFVVLINETDGYDQISNLETPCERHKKKLIEYTSTGTTSSQQFDANTVDVEAVDCDRTWVEEDNTLLDEDIEVNPFQKWAEDIFEKSKSYVNEGNGINAMYLPTLVPLLIKCMKLLPLWSGIMVSVFGYGTETASSAAVESSFKKLKTVTFKNGSLPLNIEEFLEQHITSLHGASLIHSLNKESYKIIPIKENATVNESKKNLCLEEEIEINMEQENDYLLIPDKQNCPLCSAGSLPSKDGPHKCYVCEAPVHALSSCSKYKIGQDNKRICFTCFILEDNLNLDIESENENTSQNEENRACESWNRTSQRKSNSYLVPNPHLRHLDLNNSKNIKGLPILKNGSRFKDLKSCKSNTIQGRTVLTNTCAFDSLTSLIMVSYCDSQQYSKKMDLISSHQFLNFIKNIVKYGVTSSTYLERADIIINKANPELKLMQYDTTLVVCDSTVGSIINAMLKDFPSVQETIKCSSNCEGYKQISHSLTHLTYQTSDGLINNLQSFLNDRLQPEQKLCGNIHLGKKCKGTKYITPNISEFHLFIDVLYWEGENVISDDRTSEAAAQVEIRLSDIPQLLRHGSTTYELRGVISFKRGKSSLRKSIGHYHAYAKRGARNWQIFDDLKKKPIPVKDSKVVTCEFLIYTI